jgi:UDP-galactopyranose mutase
MKNPDLLVVGSGFFGATVAEQAASLLNLKVLVIDKRLHIGGNAYSENDEETGIEVHKYGTHIFHTNSPSIIEYVNKFTQLNAYNHFVKTTHNNKVFDFPINLHTLNQFFNKNYTPEEAKLKFQRFATEYPKPQNLEQKAISMVGPELYNAFIKNYTFKQWNIEPQLLPAGTINRIPVRWDFRNNYFDDKFQGVPIDGYANWISRMLQHPNIEVKTGIDFLENRNIFTALPTVYSGKLDEYFNYSQGSLNWRKLRFETEKIEVNDYQGISVMNYADLTSPFTRIHEFKHLNKFPSKAIGKTIIMREYSDFAKEKDEAYYPVNAYEDRVKLKRYRILTKNEKNIFFGGRLGSYKYLDMHMAIASAMELVRNELGDYFKNK